MRVIVPMVTTNSVLDENDKFIKPLYEINRKTIFEYVIGKLKEINNVQFVFIISEQDCQKFHLDDVIKLLIPESKIVIAKGNTKGSACSCLLAINEICDDEPMVISGVDQYLNIDLNKAIEFFIRNEYDGGAITFEDIHPKWSYLKLNEEGFAIEAAEKKPISKNACVGFFYYKTGKRFVDAVKQMILKDANVNGQFYVCPAFNQMILKGMKIGVYQIEKKDYYSFMNKKGIDDFNLFLGDKK